MVGPTLSNRDKFGCGSKPAETETAVDNAHEKSVDGFADLFSMVVIDHDNFILQIWPSGIRIVEQDGTFSFRCSADKVKSITLKGKRCKIKVSCALIKSKFYCEFPSKKTAKFFFQAAQIMNVLEKVRLPFGKKVLHPNSVYILVQPSIDRLLEECGWSSFDSISTNQSQE